METFYLFLMQSVNPLQSNICYTSRYDMAYEPFCQPLFVRLLFSRYVVSDSFETIWTVACQAPLSMGFLSQEYCNGLPCPSPRHFPNPGTESISPTWQLDFFTPEPPGKPQHLRKFFDILGQNQGRVWLKFVLSSLSFI